jgi:phage head maturation protease
MSTLIAYGGAAKALGDGKFEAPLVTFSDANAKDLTGEYFSAATDFWTLKEGKGEVVLLYGHGQDATIKHARLGSGKAALEVTEAGIWMSGQLNLADEYESAIYSMIEAGKMGTSSGAVAHLVTKDADGHIKSWPLFEGSLTPTPAEPRNKVISVKSFKGLLVSDWSNGTEGEFEGIGRQLLEDGLHAIFRRVYWSLYETLDDADEDPEKAAGNMDALIDKACSLAKRYSRHTITTFSALEATQQEAVTEGLKALVGGKVAFPAAKDLERFLREAAGLSRREATAVASKGFSGLQRDAEPAAPKTLDIPKDRSFDDATLKALEAEALALTTKTSQLVTVGLSLEK